jgi:hypothetical protein
VPRQFVILETDDLGGFALFRHLDLLTCLLLLQQFLQRILVLVFELLRMKVASLGLNDVLSQLQHVLRNLFVRDVVEVVGLLARPRQCSTHVPKKEIDELYLNNPYYIVPDGEVGQQAFAVIREAISEEGMVALGRVVLLPASTSSPWSHAARDCWA